MRLAAASLWGRGGEKEVLATCSVREGRAMAPWRSEELEVDVLVGTGQTLSRVGACEITCIVSMDRIRHGDTIRTLVCMLKLSCDLLVRFLILLVWKNTSTCKLLLRDDSVGSERVGANHMEMEKELYMVKLSTYVLLHTGSEVAVLKPSWMYSDCPQKWAVRSSWAPYRGACWWYCSRHGVFYERVSNWGWKEQWVFHVCPGKWEADCVPNAAGHNAELLWRLWRVFCEEDRSILRVLCCFKKNLKPLKICSVDTFVFLRCIHLMVVLLSLVLQP